MYNIELGNPVFVIKIQWLVQSLLMFLQSASMYIFTLLRKISSEKSAKFGIKKHKECNIENNLGKHHRWGSSGISYREGTMLTITWLQNITELLTGS